ncbi:aldo/keto reductase [Streptomyces sp. NPDC041003]|uniref:aldo/keto reductase n=1 Tax=Streptomyces sp. NPDC041003 TaxID=3155730 RepID=UPI0033DA8E4E
MTASLGLGTYKVRDVAEAGRTACSRGTAWIDTAPNYGRAHEELAPVLAEHPQVKVSTKTGFFGRQEGTAAGHPSTTTRPPPVTASLPNS